MIDTTNFKAREEIAKLLPQNSVGIELGVAQGKFAEKLLKNPCFSVLYGVDAYAGDRGHDDKQYNEALEKLSQFGERYVLIRKSFSQAVKDFADNYFDFIYIDGYAHTGQDEGKTLQEWYPKLKSGGIFSGDDYTLRYEKNYNVINEFIAENKLELHVINDWNSHRTWLCVKP